MVTQPIKPISRRKSKLAVIRKLVVLFFLFSIFACLLSVLFYIPSRAARILILCVSSIMDGERKVSR